MTIRCIFISFSFLLFSSSTKGAEGNLLKCRDLNLFLGDCSLVPTTIVPEAETERSIEVRFLYDCVGHSIQLGFQANGFYRITPSREPQTITISGKSLRLVDKDPQSTRWSNFDFGCELKILEKKILLSSTSREELKRTEKEAFFIKDSLASFRALAKETTGLLKTFNIATLEELVWQREQLIAMIKRLNQPSLLNLLELFEMPEESLCISEIKEKYNASLEKVIEAGKSLETNLLDTLTEQKFRTLQILFDSEQEANPEWQALLSMFDDLLTANEGS